jgi:hypothetical protein
VFFDLYGPSEPAKQPTHPRSAAGADLGEENERKRASKMNDVVLARPPSRSGLTYRAKPKKATMKMLGSNTHPHALVVKADCLRFRVAKVSAL